MILELIYCCCVTCTDAVFLWLSDVQSLSWERFLTWAWGFHYELVVGQALIKRATKLPFWPYAVTEHMKGKSKKRWAGQGRHSLGWGLLNSGCNRARAQCAVCRALFPVPTRASWEGNCLQSPCSCVWGQTALQAMNASCFSSCMVN